MNNPPNINGYCPHCNANMDGDLVIDYPLSQGKTMEEAIEYASSYTGWGKHGILNRWGRQIDIYDMRKDRTVAYKCPDCGKEF
jgi:hypothetical protein